MTEVSVTADIDSSGPGPVQLTASLIVEPMLKTDADSGFHDWK